MAKGATLRPLWPCGFFAEPLRTQNLTADRERTNGPAIGAEKESGKGERRHGRKNRARRSTSRGREQEEGTGRGTVG